LNQAIIATFNLVSQRQTTLSSFLVGFTAEYEQPAKKGPSVGGAAAAQVKK
jgi:hypothetical protein